MNALTAKILSMSVLGASLAVASLGVLGQSGGDATVSLSEVQNFIEQKVSEGFPIEEAVASGLELGFRPEVIAAVLLNLSLEPARIAVALASEGVPKVEAAKAVITVAGTTTAPPVLDALLIGSSQEERVAVTQQVTAFVATVTQTTQQPQTPQTPSVTEEVVVQAPEQETPAVSTTETTGSTEPTTGQTTQQETAVVQPPVTEPTQVIESAPLPLVVVFTPPTPPIQGGGGGATSN